MSKKHSFKVGDKVRLKKEFVGEDGKAKIVLQENQKDWTASLNPGFDPVEMTVLSIDKDGDFNENGSPWQAYELVEAAPKKLSGAAKTAHEKKLAQSIPPCFPDAPRPKAKVGEKPETAIVGFSCRLGGVDFDIDGKATISAQTLGDAFAAVPGLREAMLKLVKEA